jgi:hypothetical protein
MSRLFLTRREIEFINDINKELIKDIVGQKIIYWPVSTMKTQVDPLYKEAINKIFENPIKLDVLAGQPEWSTVHNQFGQEQTTKLEIYVQARDLIDKNFFIHEGDFFTYNDIAYEIVSFVNLGNIYGLEEYATGFKLIGILARPGEFDPMMYFKPQVDSNDSFIQSDVQIAFEQQRGISENSEGPTLDIRQLRERLGEDSISPALGEGPRKIDIDEEQKSNVFYDE